MPDAFYTTRSSVYDSLVNLSSEALANHFDNALTYQTTASSVVQPAPLTPQQIYKNRCSQLRKTLNYGLSYKGKWEVQRDETKQRLVFTLRGFRMAVINQTQVTIWSGSKYKFIFEEFAKRTNRKIVLKDKIRTQPLKGASKLDWWTKPLPQQSVKQPEKPLTTNTIARPRSEYDPETDSIQYFVDYLIPATE